MPMSLLLVEDKLATRTHLLAILAQTNFTVDYAVDGLDGLNKAKAMQYDFIVLDHKMPLMDGMSLLRNLRDITTYRQTPIVFMTTQDLKQVEPIAKKAGATTCLAKPIDAASLIGAIDGARLGDVA